ncbi:MAG: hypothetical protein MUE88_02240 [Flavobacteriales bacterium]|nr:hypothetical protein [Flavobacteriales bacterium]
MRSTIIAALCMPVMLSAQWELPVPLELTGSAPADRQVLGLADPVAADAAISAEAVRSGAATRVAVTGSFALSGQLTPPATAYTVGMVITIIPDQRNDSAATLVLNDLPAVPLVRPDGMPLLAGDLFPAVPARFIYDGAGFRMLGTAYRPCPTGFHPATPLYCIADSSREAVTFFDAITTCAAQNARLCTYSEWVHACERDPLFLGTVLDFEWVDDAANTTNGAKRVGNGTDGVVGTPPGINCRHGGWTVPTNTARYRCCRNR